MKQKHKQMERYEQARVAKSELGQTFSKGQNWANLTHTGKETSLKVL